MENQPLVSVIMPSFNAESFIAESIESVLHQTYQNWELIITDDCSNDHTPDIVQSYCKSDPRINFAIAKQHSGIAGTRNHCLSRVKGRLVAFLDNDDIWYPEKLEKQVRFIIENNYSFVYSEYELMNEDGSPKGKIIKTAGIIDYDKYLKNTIIGSGTIMLDTNKTGRLQMPNNATSDDMALWCSIMRHGIKAYPMDEVLYQYRIRNNGASSHRMKMVKSVWKVYRKQEKLSLMKSISCFVCYAFNAFKKRL